MYHYKIVDAEQLVQIFATGEVDLQASIDIFRTAVNDTRYLPHFDFLIDTRDMSIIPAARDILLFADFLGQMTHVKGRFAVVTVPGAPFGMARMMATVAGLRSIRMHVFLDVPPAREWLLAAGLN